MTARTLVYSLRGINKHVFASGIYEFEDVITDAECADVVSPPPSENDVFRSLLSTANRVGRATKLARSPRHSVATGTVDRGYDLFFAAVMFPYELIQLRGLKNWRQRCRTCVCFVADCWAHVFEDKRSWYVDILREFDHIILPMSGSVAAARAAINRPCTFVPGGVDALRFCPYPKAPERRVDVYAMGRRSPGAHAVLLRNAKRSDFFYLFDTAHGFTVRDHAEHRQLLASLIQRSKFFLTWRHGADLAEISHGQEEISLRLFEGLAGGAVLVGLPPTTPLMEEMFGDSGAFFKTPYDGSELLSLLEDLSGQSEHLAKVRAANVARVLRHHDWIYRWKAILGALGLTPEPGVAAREAELARRAALFSAE